jgi:hypothetical protein
VEDAPRFFLPLPVLMRIEPAWPAFFETPADSKQKLWIIVNRPQN